VRDIIWILGGIFLMLLLTLLVGGVCVLLELDVRLYPVWSPWRAIYDWVRSQRGKKYKSREDVI
jgi:hypothetical protein